MLSLLKAVSHSSSDQNLTVFKGFLCLVFTMAYQHQSAHAPGWFGGNPSRGTDALMECRTLLLPLGRKRADRCWILHFGTEYGHGGFGLGHSWCFSTSPFAAGGCSSVLTLCSSLEPAAELAVALHCLSKCQLPHLKSGRSMKLLQPHPRLVCNVWLWSSAVLGFCGMCSSLYFVFSWEAFKSKRFIQKSV